MPTIRTKSGKTLDEVLNDECHDPDSLTATAHAFLGESIATVDYTTADGVRHIDDVPITRRGDSIVPPALGGVVPRKEGIYRVYIDDKDNRYCDDPT